MSKSRFRSVALRLQRREGFWFPWLSPAIGVVYRRLSIGHWLNTAIDRRNLGGAWVSEAYQAVVLLIGIVWLGLIGFPILTATPFVVAGALVALYRPVEIVLFALHWLLVARGPVKDYRRSLAGFLVNLLEVGLFAAIALTLLGAFPRAASAWGILVESLAAVLTFSVPEGLRRSPWIAGIALLQLAAAWLVAVLVLANVVGGIARGETEDHRPAV